MTKEPDDSSPAPDQLDPTSAAEPEVQDVGQGQGDTPGSDQDQVSDIQTLRAQLQEAQDRALRLNAELENFRKRSWRTIEEERKYASLPLMRDLLTVLDNLQRAIAAAQQNEGSAALLEGVKMVADQLIATLQKYQCTEIDTNGVPFDPHLHEALAQFPSQDVAPGEIMQVTQVGYQLHDRVVRPSQVILAAPRPSEDSP